MLTESSINCKCCTNLKDDLLRGEDLPGRELPAGGLCRQGAPDLQVDGVDGVQVDVGLVPEVGHLGGPEEVVLDPRRQHELAHHPRGAIQ